MKTESSTFRMFFARRIVELIAILDQERETERERNREREREFSFRKKNCNYTESKRGKFETIG